MTQEVNKVCGEKLFEEKFAKLERHSPDQIMTQITLDCCGYSGYTDPGKHRRQQTRRIKQDSNNPSASDRKNVPWP